MGLSWIGSSSRASTLGFSLGASSSDEVSSRLTSGATSTRALLLGSEGAGALCGGAGAFNVRRSVTAEQTAQRTWLESTARLQRGIARRWDAPKDAQARTESARRMRIALRWKRSSNGHHRRAPTSRPPPKRHSPRAARGEMLMLRASRMRGRSSNTGRGVRRNGIERRGTNRNARFKPD